MLRGLARDRVVAEAGCLLGYSTIVMAQVARHVTAIDPHDGYPVYAPRPTLQLFCENVRRAGVEDRITEVVGFGQDHIPAAEVVFLDLTGERHVTEACMRRAQLAGAGAIAVHDYARGGCEGATEAVDSFVRQNGWDVTRTDTLVVLTKTH